MTTAFMFKDMRTGFWWWWWKRQQKKLMFFIRSGYGEGHEKAANTSWSESEGENIWKKNKQINIYNVQKFFDHKCFSRTIKVAEVHQAEEDYLLSDNSLQVGFVLQDQNLRLHLWSVIFLKRQKWMLVVFAVYFYQDQHLNLNLTGKSYKHSLPSRGNYSTIDAGNFYHLWIMFLFRCL